MVRKSYVPALILLFAGVVMGLSFFAVHNLGNLAQASIMVVDAPFDGPNNPMGVPQGVVPGRVVWAWNPDATNAGMENVPGDAFWDYQNNDTLIIRNMVERSLLLITEAETHQESWETIFTHHNEKKYGETRGYLEGETIFIKINQGTASWLVNDRPEYGWPESGGLNAIDPSWKRNYFGATETGPFVVLNILRQLVNVAGIPQENIYVGDPMSIIFKHNFDVWYAEFPNVKYIEKRGTEYNRTLILPADEHSLIYSDEGAVLEESTEGLFSAMEEADYMINIATFKPHKRGGVTFGTKNHFGSITRPGAGHLHPSLVSTSDQGGVPHNDGYQKYRVMVDIMGHKYLGANTMLFIIEGLFGGSEDEVLRPIKYYMPPFNGDWTNSVFMSLDQVAIESVAYDFMRAEFDGETNPGLNGNYPNWPNWYGVDDYLHQAADPANWPEGFEYKPDGETVLASLGVHEHWNNHLEKQYSGNLGMENGIELYSTNGFEDHVSVQELALSIHGLNLFPNPSSDYFSIAFNLEIPAGIRLELFDMQGRSAGVVFQENLDTGNHQVNLKASDYRLTSGYYLVRISCTNNSIPVQTTKLQLIN